MEKMSFHQKFRMAAAALLIILMIVMTLTNASLFIEPLDRLFQRKASFPDTTKAIASGYLSNKLWEKNTFIDLNGLFAGMTGKRMHNNILRLNNGMLTFNENREQYEVDGLTDRLAAFSGCLKTLGIPFLYALPAVKHDNALNQLPDGIVSFGNENITNLVSQLEQKDVSVLDLRPVLAPDLEHIEAYYYRTDHHWNTHGAFAAFRAIMEKLRELDPSIDMTYTDSSLWETHRLDNWFLGSHGKRVGTLYAGTDPLIWYTPRFDTEMSCFVENHQSFYQGTFEDANIRQAFINNRSFYDSNPYCVYIGGDYPLVQHRNAQAPNRLKILLLKDSYTLPLQAFLSTEFTEVDVIDPRYYTDSSIIEYCRWNKPDIVMMTELFIMSRSIKAEVLGHEEAQKKQTEDHWSIVLDAMDVHRPALNRGYNYEKIIPLEAGKTYRFTCEAITLQEGTAAGASVVLYNHTENKIEKNMIYNIGFCGRYGCEPWTFRVPDQEAEYSLLVYAGLPGKTSMNAVDYTGIKVYRMD